MPIPEPVVPEFEPGTATMASKRVTTELTSPGWDGTHLVVVVQQLADVEGDVEVQVMLLGEHGRDVQLNVILAVTGTGRLPLCVSRTCHNVSIQGIQREQSAYRTNAELAHTVTYTKPA